jgi:hypothetical protein
MIQAIYSQAFLKDWGSSAELLTGFTKSSFPCLKIKDGLIEIFFPEVRPKNRSKE